MRSAPNLFVIGAMKAGTSSLHSLLAQHPEIYMSPVKEPGYFIVPDGCRAPRPFATAYAGNRRAYLGLFASAGSAKYVGESSPDYTRLPSIRGVSERLWQFSSEAKLIYILRDPVTRSISHYWWNVQNHGEHRGIYEAIYTDEQYRDVSNYAMQLRPYIQQFGRERIYVMTLERLIADPDGSLRDVFSWLGLVSSHISAAHENETPRVLEVPVNGGLLHRIRFSYLWDAAGQFVPKSLRALGRRAAYKHVDRSAVPTHDVVEYLRPIQLKQVHELCDLVGREFPEWKTVQAGSNPGGGAIAPGDGHVPASFEAVDSK